MVDDHQADVPVGAFTLTVLAGTPTLAKRVVQSAFHPKAFNSDQGSQFTGAALTAVLKREGVVQ